MRKRAVGIIALLLLLVSIGILIWPSEGGVNMLLLGAFVRVGLMMSALWLAYDDVARLPGWIWAFIPILLVLLAAKPKWFLLALPIVIALIVLRPRASTKR